MGGSPTRSTPWKTYRGPPAGKITGSRISHPRREWTAPQESVPAHRHTAKTTQRFSRRDRVGCPPKGKVDKLVAISNFGGGGPTDRKKGKVRGRDNMHVLRTGSGRVNSGVREHSQADTRPVPPRRISTLQLHAGKSGPPRERAYPRSYVACISEWAGGRRHPHRAELACSSGLPTNESGQRWAALRSTVQFADLLQRDVSGPGPASSLTTGIYSSFELMVRAHGSSTTSSVLLCSLISDALGMPQEAYLDFPRSREWEVAVDRYRTLFVAFGIRSQDILLRSPNRRCLHWAPCPKILGGPRRRVRGAPHKMNPRISRRAGGGYRAPSLSGAGGAPTERNGVDD